MQTAVTYTAQENTEWNNMKPHLCSVTNITAFSLFSLHGLFNQSIHTGLSIDPYWFVFIILLFICINGAYWCRPDWMATPLSPSLVTADTERLYQICQSILSIIHITSRDVSVTSHGSPIKMTGVNGTYCYIDSQVSHPLYYHSLLITLYYLPYNLGCGEVRMDPDFPDLFWDTDNRQQQGKSLLYRRPQRSYNDLVYTRVRPNDSRISALN